MKSNPSPCDVARRPWPCSRPGVRRLLGLLLALGLAGPGQGMAAPEAPRLQPCRLKGVEHEVLCGVLRRPLDLAAPAGPGFDLHFAVLPALARHKKPDPVFFFAGGPGQSAMALAGNLSRSMGRLLNRRDLVLIDQRGTGRSAPLYCDDEPPTRPLAELVDPARQRVQLERCRQALSALPHGDLRHYGTDAAMADADAVRQALGAERINLVGGSYGTRAVLSYLRRHPQAVRRAVIDGVAPPDMAMPVSVGPDARAAFDGWLAACEAEPACRERHPRLAERWQRTLEGLPATVRVTHPLTGRDEPLQLTPEVVIGLLRAPLYLPALAAALPAALEQAIQGRWGALVGLAGALGGGRDPALRLAQGMHFSVLCTEDMPPAVPATPAAPAAAAPSGAGAAAGWDGMARLYHAVCADWPRGTVAEDFRRLPAAPVPVLVLSGALDPVTPPRHGQRVADALGRLARHVVVPHAGHGVMAIPCMREPVFRFIDAPDDDAALAVDAGCAQAMPRPLAFQPGPVGLSP